MSHPTRKASQWPWQWLPLGLALICGIAAYLNSFRGPFIFDDIDAILNNPHINRSLHDSGNELPTTLSGRPVLRVSFQANYAMSGLGVESYHATNLLFHLAAGAILFEIVRRNLLRREYWGDRFERSAPWLAGAVAAMWLVHPLNTEAVTYIVQRAESLAGLFYLAVIYCAIRDWRLAGVIACALGMGTKETMATAPIVALFYDRVFLSGSVSAALRRRWLFYLGLAAAWAIPAVMIAGGVRSSSVGFGRNISAVDYARTQLGVIAHYAWLTVWPRNLVLDYYDWPIVRNWVQVGWGGGIVALLILALVVAPWKKPWLGFLGIWFFLILAPSSSAVPIFTEVAAEHRMYLPVIAIIAMAIIGGWRLVTSSVAGRWIAAMVAIGLVAAMAMRTGMRNAEYEHPEKIWADNVAMRPLNPRAHFNLGYTLMGLGRPGEAAGEFREALALEPDYYAAEIQLQRAMRSGETSP